MKIKLCLVVFLLAEMYQANAQKAYIINDFLKGYTLYFFSHKTESETKEYYKLTENQTKKTVLEYGSNELSKPETLKTAKITAFKSIPESNIRVLGDVNFDGRQDIVIHETEINDDGCYTAQATAYVFINTPGNFLSSPSISRLYNDAYCVRGGSFEIDSKNKRVITSSSGGAALHVSSYYSISGIEAKEIAAFEERADAFSPFITITGKKWKDNNWVSVSTLSVYEPGLDKVFSFDTKNGKGRVLLFKVKDILYYAFQQNDEYKFISFTYPSSPEKADKSVFKFRKQNAAYELEFNSGPIKYIAYETPTETGIKIYVNGKLSDWQGTAKTGTLAILANTDFKNVIKE